MCIWSLSQNIEEMFSQKPYLTNCKRFSQRFAQDLRSIPLAKPLWGGQLWSPSYFAGSCGGAPIEVIRKYIEGQNSPRNSGEHPPPNELGGIL
jgi:putative transposase